MAWAKFLLCSLFIASLATAGVYECESPNGPLKPSSTKLESIDFSKRSAPHFRKNSFKNAHHEGKRPFVIYYAIDSEEPFMKYAVALEMARLKQTCQLSSAVNFVGILNSAYVARNELVVCKDKVLKTVSLSTFPALDRKLKAKHNFIGKGDHTTSQLGPMDYLVRYEQSSNESFSKFPLAHPDFLHDLLELVVTEPSLFPSRSFMPFLNLKSHGSLDMVLSGLHSCQTNSKTRSQEELISSHLTKEQRRALDADPLSQEHEEALNKLALGSAFGVGGVGMGHVGMGHVGMGHVGMGHVGMGHVGMGIISGLGADEGLGSDSAFGSYHVALNAVLARLFDEGTGRVLGFVMLESCDTNRDPNFHHTYLTGVLGFYSAKNSLWYRNLNWWAMMEQARGSTADLLKILRKETKKIVNIDVIKG